MFPYSSWASVLYDQTKPRCTEIQHHAVAHLVMQQHRAPRLQLRLVHEGVDGYIVLRAGGRRHNGMAATEKHDGHEESCKPNNSFRGVRSTPTAQAFA